MGNRGYLCHGDPLRCVFVLRYNYILAVKNGTKIREWVNTALEPGFQVKTLIR